MITIKRIDASAQQDIRLPNEPFTLWGRMIPTFDGERWAYHTQRFEAGQVSDMVFPDEHYDFEARKKDCFFVGAYNGAGQCIGLAVYAHHWLKYLYLEDLKVNRAYRSQGIGALLLTEGKRIAAENGYDGIYTIGQDNNLSACLFYLHSGFVIGGLGTHVYRGTSQAHKWNIHFYLDL